MKIHKIDKEIGLVMSVVDDELFSPVFYLRVNSEEWYVYDDDTRNFNRISLEEKYEIMFQSYLASLKKTEYNRIKGLINE